MLLKIRRFLGISPRVSPRNLETGMAQVARDTKLWTGSLKPFNQPASVASVLTGSKKSLYRFGQDTADTEHWFAWLAEVDVVRSSVPANERTYLADGAAPKVTDSSIALGTPPLPVSTYDWGVPAPTSAPSVAVSGAAGSGETPTLRFYVYTFVNAWGEEGPASPVSAGVLVAASQTVDISGLQIPTGGQGYSTKRIYETESGTTTAGFFYKKEVAAASTTASFSGAVAAVPTTDGTTYGVGSAMVTSDFYKPPASLRGIRMCAGNFIGGVAGEEVVFSAPDYLYAFPPKYARKYPFSPVGIGTYGSTIVVATKGNPYVLQGTDPAYLQETKIESLQGCVARRSIVQLDGAVGWATATGFVSVNAGGVTDISGPYFTADQWKALNPSSMHAYWWKHRLVVFYDNGLPGGLIFEANEPPVQLSLYATTAYVDPLRDELYYCTGTGATVYKFDAGTLPQTFRWRTGVLVDTEPSNIAAVVVKSSVYPVTLRTYGDGDLWDTVAIDSDMPVRMPLGELFSEWEFELEGTGEVFFMYAAASMEELKQLS